MMFFLMIAMRNASLDQIKLIDKLPIQIQSRIDKLKLYSYDQLFQLAESVNCDVIKEEKRLIDLMETRVNDRFNVQSNAFEFVANENECRICHSYDHITIECDADPVALEHFNTLLSSLQCRESESDNAENSKRESD